MTRVNSRIFMNCLCVFRLKIYALSARNAIVYLYQYNLFSRIYSGIRYIRKYYSTVLNTIVVMARISDSKIVKNIGDGIVRYFSESNSTDEACNCEGQWNWYG
jgi:hypothetical protein